MELEIANYIATIRIPWLNIIMMDFSFMGVGVFPLIVLILSALYFRIKHQSYRELLLLGMAFLSSTLLGELLKLLIGKERPPLSLAVYQETNYSMPSNHALISSAFYGLLLLLLLKKFPSLKNRNILQIVFITLIFLVGFSRIYLGVHWVSDVLAGWTLGIMLTWFFYWLDTKWTGKIKGVKIMKTIKKTV